MSLLAAGLSVLLVGISRVQLGKHHTSDVLGGYALGALWTALVLRYLRPEQRRDRS